VRARKSLILKFKRPSSPPIVQHIPRRSQRASAKPTTTHAPTARHRHNRRRASTVAAARQIDSTDVAARQINASDIDARRIASTPMLARHSHALAHSCPGRRARHCFSHATPRAAPTWN